MAERRRDVLDTVEVMMGVRLFLSSRLQGGVVPTVERG